MHNTGFNDDITQIVNNQVVGYHFRTQENIRDYSEVGIEIKTTGDFIQHHRNSPHFGGSGLYSTIEDLAQWCVNFYTKKFGGQVFIDLMHTKLRFNHDLDNQAFGLYFGEYRGRVKIAWDGGDWGFSTEMARFPNEKIAIICLSNLGSEQAFRMVNKIADILIEADIL